MLFQRISIFDVLQHQERMLKDKIQSLESNYVLNASESDLVAWLAADFKLDIPVLDESKIEVEQQEKQVDVSRDPRRIFMHNVGPFYVPGIELTFIVPFTGDATFFDVQPQSAILSTAGSRAQMAKWRNPIHLCRRKSRWFISQTAIRSRTPIDQAKSAKSESIRRSA